MEIEKNVNRSSKKHSNKQTNKQTSERTNERTNEQTYNELNRHIFWEKNAMLALVVCHNSQFQTIRTLTLTIGQGEESE